ncbi:uncharacterized protein LOC127750386 [Frankliniella occidentalis]|uniref:Uncharacterized protein LOC127750386 n=1 Tax=Frankliniella occidentalis TaxID=133901 RepID=A0A9C6X2I0_FRAOC|nr:uncharacterized protein LOC127750386 [Frankliniella occidentalis]
MSAAMGGDQTDDTGDNGGKKEKIPRKKHKIPHRRRYTRIKKAKQRPNNPTIENAVEEDIHEEPLDLDVVISAEVCSSPLSTSEHDYARPASATPTVSRPDSTMSRSSSSFSRPGSSLSGCDKNLSVSLPDLSEDNSMSDSLLFSPISSDSCYSPSPQPPSTPQKESEAMFHPPLPPPDILSHLLLGVRNKLLLMLPNFFTPVVDNKGIHVLMIGRRESKAVQRDVFVSSSGVVRIEVHGKPYSSVSILQDVMPPKPLLTEEDTGYFLDRISQIVNKVRLLEICAGMDSVEFKDAWDVTCNGVSESDVFKECRYRETYRSNKCSLLLPAKFWRCKECTKLQPILKRRMEFLQKEEVHENTNTRYLSDQQKDNRLASKQKTIKKQSITIGRLQKRMQELIARKGVKVEKELSDDLTEILQSSNLSISHSLFLQQQLKAVNAKKSCGMRWHPTMIRLALSIYLKSPSAYRSLTESGFIKLPTARTLFDYSHATKIKQGIDTTVLENIAKQVAVEEKSRKQYHTLMADEMHISKNLVVQKSTGEIIGFTNLDELDKEVKILDSYLDNPDKVVEEEMASKIMAFMVRGISSRVKDVIASYPVSNPSARQMYIWTWDIIGALEKSGVRVIAFTCDGAPTNRAFFKLHKPVTVLDSKVIFDTVNKFAPNRVLYFFSDVPHLLKTTRNALFNSRPGKKGTRCLRKNGQTLVWDTIIRLYLSKKDATLRKSYKLNAQSVFPDSYSKMKVHLAASVISKTVANDISSQQWPNTSKLVDFLLKTNNWFDLLNGASTSHGARKNNRRLDPYTQSDLDDFKNNSPTSRFKELFDYLDYLNAWEEEITQKKLQGANMSMMSELGVQQLEEVSFHALEESKNEESEFDSKCLLPHQTLLGIEMSTRAFVGAVSFLIGEGISFVNARSFCQDPLEQNFGKQRQGGGGSSAPNVQQYYFKQRNISTIGQLAAAKRNAGNTEIVNEGNNISSEPLPKRKYVRGKK